MDFNQLVETNYDSIFRFCYYFVKSKEEAEDLAQEVFIKAHQKLDTLQSDAATKSWLFQIARNKCIDSQRWWKRLFAFKEQAGALQLNSSHSPDMKIGLARALDLLPKKQKAVFIYRQLMDLSTEQTAEIMQISEGTVKSHLSRAISKLAEEFKE